MMLLTSSRAVLAQWFWPLFKAGKRSLTSNGYFGFSYGKISHGRCYSDCVRTLRIFNRPSNGIKKTPRNWWKCLLVKLFLLSQLPAMVQLLSQISSSSKQTTGASAKANLPHRPNWRFLSASLYSIGMSLLRDVDRFSLLLVELTRFSVRSNPNQNNLQSKECRSSGQ